MSNEPQDLADQIKAIWQGDQLGRAADAELIHRFINGRLQQRENAGLPRTFVLNLDSDWGSGKSFFLTRFQKELTVRGHVAVYVNAWEDDHSDDPFLTVVTKIIDALENVTLPGDAVETILEKTKPLRKSAGKIAATTMFAAGKHIAKRYVGPDAVAAILGETEDDDAPSDLAETIVKANNVLIDNISGALLDTFNTQKAAHASFSDTLAELSQTVLEDSDTQAPIYVLIDELDRCRPAYAVEMLERIKHLFSVRNFVFVLGTDTTQLAHAVRGLYGGDFDGTRYLNRFVDRTYTFQPVPLIDFVQYTFDRLGLTDASFTLPHGISPVTFLETMFQADGIELRDIEQMLEMIATFVAVWPWDDLPIDLIYLLPQVHRKHLKVPTDAEYEAPLLSMAFQFQQYSSTSEYSYNLAQMEKRIKNSSNLNSYDRLGHNSFSEWLKQKNSKERNYSNTHLNGRSVILKYPELLETVARLD